MTADDPRKRQHGIKAGEAEAIKIEMSELARRRNNEHREIMSEVSLIYSRLNVKTDAQDRD